jgi:hypothetical protein
MRRWEICTCIYVRILCGKKENNFSSSNIIRQIKSGQMIWAGHVAYMGEETKVYKVLVGKPKGRGHSEDRDIDGIKMDLREIGWGECGLDSTGSR